LIDLVEKRKSGTNRDDMRAALVEWANDSCGGGLDGTDFELGVTKRVSMSRVAELIRVLRSQVPDPVNRDLILALAEFRLHQYETLQLRLDGLAAMAGEPDLSETPF
jgi:hypothetical protein